jgi:MFS family permease
MSDVNQAASAVPAPPAHDARTIGLVGLAHGVSHFHHLLLPTLFPVFAREFGLSFAELGLLMTVFFAVSGIGQTMSGFLVDRVGARPVLFIALLCFVAAGLVTAGAGLLGSPYAGLMAAAVLAGVGNAPFHPVDFTILNHRVSLARLGHAFSVHGISGNLGWALAPAFLIGLHSATGSWRLACAAAAVATLGVTALLWWQRAALDDRPAHAPLGPHTPNASGAQPILAPTSTPAPALSLGALLSMPTVWLCFGFFFWSTSALSAVQSFASPALQQMYGLREAHTAFVVTGFMLAGALGMVLGGFLVARVQRLERTIAGAMAASAGLFLLTASGALPPLLAAVAVMLAGLGTGLAGPSRDMLIKRATPPGATGRVYGLVYSGLDLGFAVSAPVLGHWMDQGRPAWVFAGAAAVLLLAIGSAHGVGQRTAARLALTPGRPAVPSVPGSRP